MLSDPELKELAQEEIKTAKEKLPQIHKCYFFIAT